MMKVTIRKYFASALLAVMVYPMLVQSFHVLHSHHHHHHEHLHQSGSPIIVHKHDSDGLSHCFICDVHLNPGFLHETKANPIGQVLIQLQKFVLYHCDIPFFTGANLALRAPPHASDNA